MKSALVTGANKGIGFEVARMLAQKGFHVYLGCRDEGRGSAAVRKLNDEGIQHVEALPLDVADPQSIEAARSLLGGRVQVLDVLVNNAGISGGFQQSALASDIDQFRTVFETNVFGVAGVTQAFMDLLKKSFEPRIVNVTTAMGSLTLAADLNNPVRLAVYQASKAALNMYTLNLAYELRDTPFKINAVCPGYTQTDFTNHAGTSTVQQAAERIVKFALIGTEGPTGKYFSEEYFPGAYCPW
jgi:NAD(P)-dependent dehydrogenase (short-subunit alcohol dehydrogenase family)